MSKLFKDGVQPAVLVMMGPSGSGKSTIAKELSLALECGILSSDEIRKLLSDDEGCQSINQEVFQLLDKVLRIRCKQGLSTIVDTTAVTAKARRSLINTIRDCRCTPVLVVAELSLEKCIERSLARARQVPEHVIEKQYKSYTASLDKIEGEGWSQIMRMNMDLDYK
jgi:predicted kinase